MGDEADVVRLFKETMDAYGEVGHCPCLGFSVWGSVCGVQCVGFRVRVRGSCSRVND